MKVNRTNCAAVIDRRKKKNTQEKIVKNHPQMYYSIWKIICQTLVFAWETKRDMTKDRWRPTNGMPKSERKKAHHWFFSLRSFVPHIRFDALIINQSNEEKNSHRPRVDKWSKLQINIKFYIPFIASDSITNRCISIALVHSSRRQRRRCRRRRSLSLRLTHTIWHVDFNF